MGELAAVGTMIYREDGTPYGAVTRATAASVWVGSDRLIAAGSPGWLKSYAGYPVRDFLIDGSEALVSRLAWLARRRETEEAESRITLARSRISTAVAAASGRRSGEPDPAYLARLQALEAALAPILTPTP